MRVALCSDIHANLLAWQAVLADMARQGPFDELVIAGDLVWAGAWPAETVDRIRELEATVIQGNTDAYFAYDPQDPPGDKPQDDFAALQAWMRERLGAERVAYLLGLPFAHRISPEPGHDLLVVHATPTSLEQHLMPKMGDEDFDALLGPEEQADWEVLAFGHYHVPFVRQWRSRMLVDVSSVGLPRDGDHRAVYAILTWDGKAWQAEHRRVFYDVPVVAHVLNTCGIPQGKLSAERLMRARYSNK